MLAFLEIIFVLFLIFILIGFSIIRAVFRTLFGFNNQNQKTQSNNTAQKNRVYDTWQQPQSESAHNGTSQAAQGDINDIPNINRRKIFNKNEGEYVDYEEVK